MNNENILRVIQALEIQEVFNYILTLEEITYLSKNGYIVRKAYYVGVGLYDCLITKQNITD